MPERASVFRIVFSNLIGFDGLIFLLAILDSAVLWRTKAASDRLYAKMYRTLYVPSPKYETKVILDSISRLREDEVVAMRRKENWLYTMFVSITAIFPLMGILGTVLSLLPMVSDMANIQTNFFAALTSTFWGLVFAILFKLLDGLVAPRMEENEKTVALFLSRNQQQVRRT